MEGGGAVEEGTEVEEGREVEVVDGEGVSNFLRSQAAAHSKCVSA